MGRLVAHVVGLLLTELPWAREDLLLVAIRAHVWQLLQLLLGLVEELLLLPGDVPLGLFLLNHRKHDTLHSSCEDTETLGKSEQRMLVGQAVYDRDSNLWFCIGNTSLCCILLISGIALDSWDWGIHVQLPLSWRRQLHWLRSELALLALTVTVHTRALHVDPFGRFCRTHVCSQN